MFKKIKILIAIFSFVSLGSSAQTIKFDGTTDKKFDGNQIIIYNRSGLHDSAIIKNGTFVFDAPFKEAGLFMFYSQLESKNKGGYSPFGVLVTAPGTIHMNADAENFANTKVTGSEENDLYHNFSDKSNNAQQKIIDELEKKYGKEYVMNRNPDTASTKYKQLLEDYQNLSNANEKIQLERLKQFIQANPAAFASVFLLNNYATNMDLNELENLYTSLSPKYKNTKSGKSIASVIEARKITAIGKIAPGFSLPDTSGNIVNLSDFRGSYLLIDFWASWCGPCRAANPGLVKVYNKYKNKGFKILGVSLDRSGQKDSWLNAIHKDGLVWSQVSDLKFWDNKVAVLYGIKAIPTNFLLDPQGKIVARDLSEEDLNQKLAGLLNK